MLTVLSKVSPGSMLLEGFGSKLLKTDKKIEKIGKIGK
jgi:hypothetical protein